ncbi:hypothetical protein MCEMSEM23_00192 [Rhabdaerophilaceae bacterium]
MSIFGKSVAIAFTVLALGASAQAQSQGGGRGGGAGGGHAGESGIMDPSPNAGPVTHQRERGPRSNDRVVRIIHISPCADGNAYMNRAVCRPIHY